MNRNATPFLSVLVLMFASSILFAQSPRFELSEETLLIRKEKSQIDEKDHYGFRAQSRVPRSENAHPEEGLFTTRHGGVELIAKRDAYSKTFLFEDGTYGLLQAQTPLHYRDSQGRWLSYDDSFGAIGEDNVGVIHTDMPVFVSKDNGNSVFSLDNSGNQILFTPDFEMTYDFGFHQLNETVNRNPENLQVFSNINEVHWRNAWSAVDRIQKLYCYDIETDYVIKTKPQFVGSVPQSILFTEKLILPVSWKIVKGQGTESSLGWHGELLLLDNHGVQRAVLDVPVYYDTPTQGKANTLIGAYQYALEGNKLTLSVVVESEWLLNSDLSYPVVIDPLIINSLSGDRNVGPTSGSSSACQHTMNINVPAGIISVVETVFPMQARNSGWMSEQRANFGFNNIFSGDFGPFCNTNGTGTCTAGIIGGMYINHTGGNIQAVLQPWKTWASSGQDACNQHNQRVRSDWTVLVAYAVQTGNEIVYDWVGLTEQLFIVPEGYCQAEIEVWGAGGGGGGVYSGWLGGGVRAGGGGGGAYARTTISVEQGDPLFIFVGEGGFGGLAGTWALNPTDGGDGFLSYVDNISGPLAEAHGGEGGRFRRGDGTNGSKNGAGATTGLNNLYNGGNGGANNQSHGSGGGGGAGNAGHGGNGSGTSFGAGGAGGGGNGGAHQEGNLDGNPGAVPGGGGGGAKRCADCGGRTGGLGGDGRVIIRLTPNPADGALSAVSPTTVCLGDAIEVAPNGGEGTPRYWIQSPVGFSTWNVGENQAPNTASNGYSFVPTVAGTYRIHARWQNDCGFCWNIPGHDWATNNKCTEFAFVDFEVVAPSVAPNAIDVVGLPICRGGALTLNVVGGSLSAGAQWEWFESSCGSAVIQTGASIDVSPENTTTYFVRASSGTGCAASSCASETINLPAATTNLAVHNDNATCRVEVDDWVHFYNNAGRLIASVHSGGQDLGEVTARSFVNSSAYIVPSCSEPANQSFWNAALARTFVISPDNQPTIPVSVRLYILDSEFADYQSTASTTSTNTNDDATSLSNLHLTKVAGGNDDGDPTNNCTSGTHEFIWQGNSGGINSLAAFTGFSGVSYLEYTITGFSQFFPMNSANSALPVQLTAFSAHCDQEKINITWTTASELNASHYILQSSRDGQTWLHLAEIDAVGTTNQASHYSFEDQNFGALTYYRLVQVDNDGQQEIFGPISSNCSLNLNTMTVHPNPTSENFTVLIQTAESFENAVVELMDMSGRVVMSQTTNINAGSTMLDFDGKALHAGTYMLRVKEQNDKFAPVRVVKM